MSRPSWAGQATDQFVVQRIALDSARTTNESLFRGRWAQCVSIVGASSPDAHAFIGLGRGGRPIEMRYGSSISGPPFNELAITHAAQPNEWLDLALHSSQYRMIGSPTRWWNSEHAYHGQAYGWTGGVTNAVAGDLSAFALRPDSGFAMDVELIQVTPASGNISLFLNLLQTTLAAAWTVGPTALTPLYSGRQFAGTAEKGEIDAATAVTLIALGTGAQVTLPTVAAGNPLTGVGQSTKVRIDDGDSLLVTLATADVDLTNGWYRVRTFPVEPTSLPAAS